MTNLDAYLAAMAALQLGTLNTVVLAEEGLISPERVDQIFDGVTATLEGMSPDLFAQYQSILDPQLAQLKLLAAQNWEGSNG